MDAESILHDKHFQDMILQKSYQTQNRNYTGEIFKITNPDTPFPLEILPPELRLMVYDAMLYVDVPYFTCDICERPGMFSSWPDIRHLNEPFGKWRPFTYVSEERQCRNFCRWRPDDDYHLAIHAGHMETREDVDEFFVPKICGDIDDKRESFSETGIVIAQEAFSTYLKDKLFIELLSKDCLTAFWNWTREMERWIGKMEYPDLTTIQTMEIKVPNTVCLSTSFLKNLLIRTEERDDVDDEGLWFTHDLCLAEGQDIDPITQDSGVFKISIMDNGNAIEVRTRCRLIEEHKDFIRDYIMQYLHERAETPLNGHDLFRLTSHLGDPVSGPWHRRVTEWDAIMACGEAAVPIREEYMKWSLEFEAREGDLELVLEQQESSWYTTYKVKEQYSDVVVCAQLPSAHFDSGTEEDFERTTREELDSDWAAY